MNNARTKKPPELTNKNTKIKTSCGPLKHICLVLPETVLDRFWKRFILKQEWQRRKQMKGRGQSQQQKSLSQKLTKKMFQFSIPVWFVPSLDEIGTVVQEKKIFWIPSIYFWNFIIIYL